MEEGFSLVSFLSFFTSVSDGLGSDELNLGRITVFLFLALGISFLCSLLEAIILYAITSCVDGNKIIINKYAYPAIKQKSRKMIQND